MAMTLDPATEQRIQRELDRGQYASPDEVLARALDLLEAEQEWLQVSNSAPEGRAKAIAILERSAAIPADADDARFK